MTEPRTQTAEFRTQNQEYRLKLIIGITTLILGFLMVSNALAFGGGGEHHFTWKDWVWPIINFGVLFGVLFHFGRKPVSEGLKKRTELIEKSLEEASEARKLAQKTLDEVRARLGNTDNEIEQILEAAKKSGEKEKEAIIAEGEKLKQRIIEQAKSSIDFELQKAKDTIKADAALLALEMAEKQLKEQLGQKEQENLIDDYITRLEAKN